MPRYEPADALPSIQPAPQLDERILTNSGQMIDGRVYTVLAYDTHDATWLVEDENEEEYWIHATDHRDDNNNRVWQSI